MLSTFAFKAILIVIFIAAVVSLGFGYYFLLKDKGKSRRVANALLIRVTLCAILLVLLVYGYYAGILQMTSPVGLSDY